jgi:hypothetical protein
MAMDEDVPVTRWASVWRGVKFTCMSSLSGYRFAHSDPKGLELYLDPQVDDWAVGAALLDTLGRSRFVRPDEAPEVFDHAVQNRAYKQWLRDVLKRYGYKSAKQAFKGAANCIVEMTGGQIEMFPLHLEGFEGGDALEKDQHVFVSPTASEAQIGAALRLALDRSIPY